MNENQPKKTSKSERTRSEILAAARHLFAELGYDGASIRDVAARASIDPAMVIRYFRSKDELFARAASIDLKLPALDGVEPGRIGDMLIRRFLDVWESGGAIGGMTVLLRSAASNEFAAERMGEVFAAQVMPVVGSIGNRADANRRAGLISSQLLGLAMCRYILKLPPVMAMSRDDITALVGPTLQRYATGVE